MAKERIKMQTVSSFSEAGELLVKRRHPSVINTGDVEINSWAKEAREARKRKELKVNGKTN